MKGTYRREVWMAPIGNKFSTLNNFAKSSSGKTQIYFAFVSDFAFGSLGILIPDFASMVDRDAFYGVGGYYSLLASSNGGSHHGTRAGCPQSVLRKLRREEEARKPKEQREREEAILKEHERTEHEFLGLAQSGSNSVDRMGSALQRAWLKKKGVFTISLAENHLPWIPHNIVAYTHVVRLHLDKNMLHEIPSVLGELPNLELITLCGNCISIVHADVVDAWAVHGKLRSLDFEGNPLAILPLNLGKLHLETLNMSSTHMIAPLRDIHYQIGTEIQDLCSSLQVRGPVMMCREACMTILQARLDKSHPLMSQLSTNLTLRIAQMLWSSRVDPVWENSLVRATTVRAEYHDDHEFEGHPHKCILC